MRQIIITAFMSLDGVMEAPGGEAGYRNTGWTFKGVEFDEAAYELKGREQEQAGGLLLGRRSSSSMRRTATGSGWRSTTSCADARGVRRWPRA